MANTIKINATAVRANARMTMEEWAEKLGVNKDTVLNWEKGRTEPKMNQVRMMSELSGIPLEYIYFENKSTEIVPNEEDQERG